MSHESELVGYVLCQMLKAEQMKQLCGEKGIRVPNGARAAQCRAISGGISFADLHAFCTREWQRPNAALHIANLTSGLLQGFSWHHLSPARLHSGLQDKVRKVAAGELSLRQFLTLGAEVIKKEYVMVAVADLTELTLVDHCGATPHLKRKALSDVVLGGYPYDVKNTSVPAGWTAAKIKRTRAAFARSMFTGADRGRARKQAKKAYNDWAINRLFVVTEEESLWLVQPEKLMDKLAKQAATLGDPYELKVDGMKMLAHVIVL